MLKVWPADGWWAWRVNLGWTVAHGEAPTRVEALRQARDHALKARAKLAADDVVRAVAGERELARDSNAAFLRVVRDSCEEN